MGRLVFWAEIYRVKGGKVKEGDRSGGQMSREGGSQGREAARVMPSILAE